MTLELRLVLKSDATFGRGDGVAGLVDAEVEHDEYGLPYLRGRSLKGLLVEECANVLYALERQGNGAVTCLENAAGWLFGRAGSTLGDDARMQVGPAQLPEALRNSVKAEVESGKLSAQDVLESLTDIRRQTAVDESRGAPDEGSLRAMRVTLRETPFVAKLDLLEEPSPEARMLLTACVKGLRRAGTGRNRGRGRVDCELLEDGTPVTEQHFGDFMTLVAGEAVAKEAHE